jgi:hypothetical protein
VIFEASGDLVRISASLGIRRDQHMRPSYGLFRGASEAAIDDAVLEDVNLEAAFYDRENLEARDTRRVLNREGRIHTLEDRIVEFLLTLEESLTLRSQGKDMPLVYP